MADEQKALGNAEFKAGNYEKAIGFFTKALKDAESCIAKAPTWAKVRECSQVCPSQSPPVRAPHHPHIAGFRTQGRGAARHGQVR
jgi:tetratricopeptide (TPR) repeat protein